MNSLKKRWLLIVSGLALALIMGAVNDAPDIGADPVGAYDGVQQIAGREDGHDGGG